MQAATGQTKSELDTRGLGESSSTGRIRESAYRPEIDSLRAFSVIAVMLSHWVPGFPHPLNWGLCGVFVFFTISGYVITRGLLVEKESGGINVRAFYFRRALRIWPIYYLSIAFIYFVWPGLANGAVFWHLLFASNILFAIKGQFQFPVHFWSLSVEEQFYLFWPILASLPTRHVTKICVAMLVASPISRWYFASGLHNIPASFFATNCNLDCLAAGALLAIRERNGDSVPNWVGIAGVSLVGALATGGIFGAHAAGDWPMGTGCAAISVWLIGWLDRTPSASSALSNAALRYIGKISYGIYIYHLFIGAYVLQIGVGSQPPLIFAAISMAATMIVASLSWRFIEKPILSLKTRRPTTT